MTRFAGQTALVTGGSSGIGKAVAARLAREGACVVINGRDPDRLGAALREIESFGAVSGVAADISREDEAERLIAEVAQRAGPLRILVNSAGIDGAGVDVLSLTTDSWRRVLEVNLTGPFLVARAAAQAMAVNGGGVIVNVASLNGLVAEPHFADYNASKSLCVKVRRRAPGA